MNFVDDIQQDEDRIVFHDACGVVLYYHCVRDVIIDSTFSRGDGAVACVVSISIQWLLLLRVPSYITFTAFIKENFAAAVKGFTCISSASVCREIYVTSVQGMDEEIRALNPCEFVGVKSHLLIGITSSFQDQNTLENIDFDCERYNPGNKVPNKVRR